MKKNSQVALATSPWAMRFPSIFDELMDMEDFDGQGSGLSVSEDDKSIYVEASLPGIDPTKVEVTLENGVLHIAGTSEEEKSDRKYYRKTASSFEYNVALPSEIDDSVEPKAESNHGVMKITFTKASKAQPKKISIKPTK